MSYEMYQPIKNNKFESQDTKLGVLKLLLEDIYTCYEYMLKEEHSIPNNEEKIRDLLLLNYMKKSEIKQNICKIYGFRFEREVPEDHTIKKEDKNITGRTDIKVLPTSGIDHDNDEAYFTIECKRLNNINLKGSTGLNAEYIKNGVLRFVTEQYSSYYKVNAMIAFIVSSIDINQNIQNINHINKIYFDSRSNTIQDIIPVKKPNIYYSKHKTYTEKEINLLHLMMDLSSHIS